MLVTTFFRALCKSYSLLRVCWRSFVNTLSGGRQLFYRSTLQFQTHGVLLQLWSQCLPVLDEICQGSLNFVRSYIRNKSAFVQFIALHGLHARSRSLFGRNVVYCAEQFNCSINDLIYGRLPMIINSYVRNSVDETTLDRLAFLRELIMIRDSSLTLSGLLTSDELNNVILHVCTS